MQTWDMRRAEHEAGTPAFPELPARDLTEEQRSPTHRALLAFLKPGTCELGRLAPTRGSKR